MTQVYRTYHLHLILASLVYSTTLRMLGSLEIGAWEREDDTRLIISTVTNNNMGVKNIPSSTNRLNLAFSGVFNNTVYAWVLRDWSMGKRG